MTIRVLIVDDQSMVRAGFRMLLSDEEDIQVVGEAKGGLRDRVQAVVPAYQTGLTPPSAETGRDGVNRA